MKVTLLRELLIDSNTETTRAGTEVEMDDERARDLATRDVPLVDFPGADKLREEKSRQPSKEQQLTGNGVKAQADGAMGEPKRDPEPIKAPEPAPKTGTTGTVKQPKAGKAAKKSK